MSDTPETREALERWRQGKINIGDELARLETERNASREDADNLQDQRDLAMKTIKRLETELAAARATIRAVLEENRHLADGDACTLARLKTLVPDWK